MGWDKKYLISEKVEKEKENELNQRQLFTTSHVLTDTQPVPKQ